MCFLTSANTIRAYYVFLPPPQVVSSTFPFVPISPLVTLLLSGSAPLPSATLPSSRLHPSPEYPSPPLSAASLFDELPCGVGVRQLRFRKSRAASHATAEQRRIRASRAASMVHECLLFVPLWQLRRPVGKKTNSCGDRPHGGRTWQGMWQEQRRSGAL